MGRVANRRQRLRTRAIGGIAACAVLAACEGAKPSPTTFTIRSEFGAESAWVEDYLHRATRVLVRMFDAPDVAPPKAISVELKKDPKSQGVGGWASPTALGFSSNLWPDEPYRHWILVHELLNLYAAHYGGAGGYPSDWWSNGRSPFPTYACCLVLAQLGLIEDAAWLKGTKKGQRDHDLYWALHRRHGFELFARFFRLVRADGIDLGKIGAPWPRADERRSLYTVAYLSLAAGENLASVVAEHGVGKKPSDWDAIHPDKPFTEYEVTAAEVEALLAVRKRLFGPPAPASTKKLEAERDRFRSGQT
jgi:hypothetical protein